MLRAVDWQATVWIAVLLIPLVLTARADLAAGPKIVTLVGITGFMVVYTVTVSTMASWLEIPVDAGLGAQLRPVAANLLALVVLAGISLPVMQWWGAYYLPFLGAVVLFATRLRTGLTFVVATGSAAAALAFLLAEATGERWTAIGATLSMFAVAGARVGEDVSERRSIGDRELAAAVEREEISRDVHDILGHSLTVLTLKAEVAQRLVTRDPAAAERELGEIVELSRAALADVRATVSRLRVPDLASQLESSRVALDAAGVGVCVSGSVAAVPLPQRELLAWALREATTNVLRHAGATRVSVELAPGRVRVTDDGTGLGDSVLGNGLSGLRERVESAGGSLVLTSPVTGPPAGPGTHPGTTLEVVL